MGMKLAGLLVVLLVGTASAQGYNGPPGSMPLPPGAVVGVGVQPVPPRVAFRQMIIERFDANHDGRLEPRERRHAAKALRKLAKRMARGERRQARQPRW
jgi:hypothetical protein